MIIKVLLLVLVAEIFAAVGQILFKKSANSLAVHDLHNLGGHANFIKEVMADPKTWFGFLAMVMSLIVWLFALADAELSLVFSLGSLQYVIILLTAGIFLKEKIDKMKLIGTLLVVAGIVFIAISK